MKDGRTPRPIASFIVSVACLGMSIALLLVSLAFSISHPVGYYVLTYELMGWASSAIFFTITYLVVRRRARVPVARKTASTHLIAVNFFILPVVVLSLFNTFYYMFFFLLDVVLLVVIWFVLYQCVKVPPPNQRIDSMYNRAAFLFPLLAWPAPIYVVILELFIFGYWLARHPSIATRPARHLVASILIAGALVISPLVLDLALVKPVYRLDFSFDVPSDVPESIVPYVENSNAMHCIHYCGDQSTLGSFRAHHMQAHQETNVFQYHVGSTEVVRYTLSARYYATGLNLTYWNDTDSNVHAYIEAPDGTIIGNSSNYYGSGMYLNETVLSPPAITPNEQTFPEPIFFVQVRFSYQYTCGSLCGGFWEDEAWFLVCLSGVPGSPFVMILALIRLVDMYVV